jgi:hydrogenase maturation protease
LSTLVLGIGNTLLSDEGIGVHVVERLRERLEDRPDVTLLDGGTLSFTLAEPIAAADHLIVVDAARLGAAPGTLRCLRDGEMDGYLLGGAKSVHEVSLGDLMDIARLSGTLPKRRALVAIEPQKLDWGDAPTAEVAAAIEPAVNLVLELIHEWTVGKYSG